jgi:hypothetical protein
LGALDTVTSGHYIVIIRRTWVSVLSFLGAYVSAPGSTPHLGFGRLMLLRCNIRQ